MSKAGKEIVIGLAIIVATTVATIVAINVFVRPDGARSRVEGELVPTMVLIAETENGQGELWRYVDPVNGNVIYAWDAPAYGGGVAVAPKKD